MNNVSSIYRLSSSKDPWFRCLTYKAKKSLLGNSLPIEDWEPVDDSDGRWHMQPLDEVWKPQPVGGEVQRFVDYPTLELSIPAFSPRAVHALRPLLERAGQLLELRHTNGPYFALHLTAQSDALDERKSDIQWFSDDVGIRARDIAHFEFKKSLIKGLSIFALKQTPRFTLVTEEFKQQVEAAGLNGFSFTKVWPLPPGVSWRKAEIEARRASKKKLNLSGESLILRFCAKSPTVSPKEKKLVHEFATELGELLAVDSLTDPYYGTVESVEFVDGDCRIFLSCPKVEGLVAHLDGWIRDVDWPGAFHIVKRFGNLFDTKAREVRLVIR